MILMVNVAQAKISQNTSYSYFKISGQSAQQIYKSLLAHAKGPGGHDAYATTSTRIIQNGQYTGGKSCRVKSYNTFLTFKINLPKLASSNAHASVKGSWQNFAGVLKRHEEHHRTLWMSCATQFNTAVLALSNSNCSTLKRKFDSLWTKTQNSCRKQNDAFDKAEQAQFLRQPFIQLVLSRN
jgi:predicted secreted Zn-dependent protease